MKILAGCAVAAGLAIMLTAAAATAHNMTVTHPNSGEIIQTHWIGGTPLPAQADGQGLFPHPPTGRNQPAGHREGLPHACQGTTSSPAVTIVAPPFGSCVHGQP